MSPRLRLLVAPAIATLAASAILVGLGIWQLYRLTWKEGILAEIDARVHAPPQPLPPQPDWAGLRPKDYEYRHVGLAGTLDNAKETLVLRPSEDGLGYLVTTPLALAGGGTVIVNRGWVPDRLKERAARAAGDPSGPVTVTGLMRAPESRNLFTPADEPVTGQFFTKDPAAIAARDGLAAAPFIVDADATPANPGGWPRGGTTVIDIPNNHFSYAMTWFGLALALVWVFAGFARNRLTDLRAETTSAVDRYIRACNFEQTVDHAAIETAMSAWCREIGAPTDTKITFVASERELARAAKDVMTSWDAAVDCDAEDARAARDAGAARAASHAWYAWIRRARQTAKAASSAAAAANDKKAASINLLIATRLRRARKAAEDVSLLARNWVGAVSRGDRRMARTWLPIQCAWEAGAFLLWKTEAEIFVAVLPSVVRLDEARRLHCANGPAFVWGSETVDFYWHGVRIPDTWLGRRETLTAADVFGERNAEVRRAGCEIIGWDRILTEIGARLVDDDGDPQIGTLYEGRLPGARDCGFLKVQCGTGRSFVELVPSGLKTAIAAQAWREGIPIEVWTKPEVRG